MKHVLRMAKKWVVVLALTSCWAVSANAQEDCSDHNLKGAFGFLVSGTNVEFNVLFSISGRFVADGQGGFTGTANQSVAGQVILQFPFTGTYAIRPDCSGSARFVFPGNVDAHLEFVIVNDGNEIIIFNSDQGTVESGTAKKQFPSRPSHEDAAKD